MKKQKAQAERYLNQLVSNWGQLTPGQSWRVTLLAVWQLLGNALFPKPSSVKKKKTGKRTR